MNCTHQHGVRVQQLPGHGENPEALVGQSPLVKGGLVGVGGDGGDGGAPKAPVDLARPACRVPALGTEMRGESGLASASKMIRALTRP